LQTRTILHSILKISWDVNQEKNARLQFETALTQLPPEQTRSIWSMYLEFEYMYGDLATIMKIEKRKSEAFPSADTTGILAIVNRHRFQDLWPCDPFTMDSFSVQVEEKTEELSQKKKEEIAAKYPRPDLSTMTPFRPGMALISTEQMGLPPLTPFAPNQKTSITAFSADNDSYVQLPDCLVQFMSLLPSKEHYTGPTNINVDFVMNLIGNAEIAPPKVTDTNLGKRDGNPSSDEPSAKLARPPTGDVFRNRQRAKLQQKHK